MQKYAVVNQSKEETGSRVLARTMGAGCWYSKDFQDPMIPNLGIPNPPNRDSNREETKKSPGVLSPILLAPYSTTYWQSFTSSQLIKEKWKSAKSRFIIAQ